MRYTLIAAISATLLSTTAFAQNWTSPNQDQNRRAYAPVATPASPVTNAFPREQMDQQRRGAPAISEQDRLFLLQGDRGLGNG